MKKKVLFICIHNSARSQMAEEFLRLLGGEEFEVESAGFEATEINSLVIQVMKEEGIDLTGKRIRLSDISRNSYKNSLGFGKPGRFYRNRRRKDGISKGTA